MDLRLLSGDDVRQSLPMASAIAAMKSAYTQLSTGKADLPLRTRINLPKVGGSALFMPAYLGETGQLAIKYVSVFPQNSKQGLPTIHAMVLAIDDTTGRPLALMEGASLTAIRTGAASGAATDVLARHDAARVAIFGSGVQARTQLEAVCAVRPIEHAYIYSLDRESAQALIRDMAGEGAIPANLELAHNPHQAACDADIICTATTSLNPVVAYKDLRQGVHINAIGSFTPEMREIDSETINQARLIVDSREAVLAESGDLIIPMREGVISEASIHAELGEILSGREPGRENATQITLFKSVGVAVQDAIAAHRALEGAIQANLGRMVSL